jgi:tRNA(adenine34) deaminase
MENRDQHYVNQCIELSSNSLKKGDAPFGSLVVLDQEIIAESSNFAARRVSDHAEVIALHIAHEKLGHSNLEGATLYSNCEPCPMCAFMAREYKVSRVVFAMHSPFMGGHSKWNIMEDRELEHFPPFFGAVPEVIGGLLEKEAKSVFEQSGLWMFGKGSRAEFEAKIRG